ncbi:hypothetical protein D3C87_1855220 [compost metagenome]
MTKAMVKVMTAGRVRLYMVTTPLRSSLLLIALLKGNMKEVAEASSEWTCCAS